MYAQSMKLIKFLVVGLVVLESLILAFFMRPIQDDYFNLQSVQQMGVLGYLENTWAEHGGNIVQFFIHCIMILPTTQAFVFWNFSLFFIMTQFLVFLAVKVISAWLFATSSQITRFWVPLLSVAGFEGLFIPGFLGAYGFTLASLAHLWPVMAFIFGLLAIKKFKGSWVIALSLGVVAGNSNLGESAFACGVWILLFLAFRRLPQFEVKSRVVENFNFYMLGLGVFVGTVGIVAAPGFWIRASDQVGLPTSLGEFLTRFMKSFASFTADGLTHPMVWVLFLLGVLLGLNQIKSELEVIEVRLKMLLVGTATIWAALIVGSTFAYPAWHQSMGMYVLLLPLSFALGYRLNIRTSQKVISSLLVASSLVMLFTFVRIGVLGVERSLQWDRNLTTNSCRIAENPSSALMGAEIQYPPFGLGVDDVNTWEWMRYKYVGWVENISERKCLAD
jgi:hypothetical protein